MTSSWRGEKKSKVGTGTVAEEEVFSEESLAKENKHPLSLR